MIKSKKYISVLVLLMIFLVSGCSKNFLDRTPVITFTQQNALATYTNFQTYAWNLYDYFSGYNGNGFYPASLTSQDCNSDNMAITVAGNQSVYMNQTKIVPTSGSTTTSLAVSGWNFSYIRRVNIMLDAVSTSSMAQADKDHWTSVGYFFRALRYYDLIAAFGDVPWVEHSLNEDSTAVLFMSRTSRDTVAQNMLNNLIWADAHIGPGSPDGVNTINQACVDALISRFGLFEGTWRKYHGLANAQTYLEACKTYSEKLLPLYPTCMSSYDAVYNTEDLTGQPGIILFVQYAANLTDHEWGPRLMGSTSDNIDVTKDAVDAYLCTDGKPISTSPLYSGDTSVFAQFRNRDRRLYYTVVPPYTVKVGSPNTTWSYTSNPADAEYINLMDTLCKVPLTKQLPVAQWSQNMNTGTIISESPHFYLYNNGQSQAISQFGFFYWKQYNKFPLDVKTYSTTDCPLFRIGEVWLNYAEAMFELGQFNQNIADETINKLRARAGVANMIVGNITAGFDTKRDPDVDPVLWEIRRERRVELMGDGFRFNDIKRWAKGAYMNKVQLGAYVNNANYGNKLSIYGGGKSGYVQFFPAPLGWLDQYYLEPIPIQEIQLNKNLVQNAGWSQ